MKKITAIVLILSSFILLFSQAMKSGMNVKTHKDDEWNKKISMPSQSVGFERIIFDNGYVAVGIAGDADVNIFAMKTNKEGNEIWNRTYDKGYGMDILKYDNGYLIIGSTPGFENAKIIVIKIDKNGNIVWKRFYTIEGGAIVMDAIKAKDGFIIGGFTSTPCNVFLLKIDEIGNEIWNKTYGGEGDEALERIINCGDGYAFAGWTSSYGSGSWDAWLVKIDENGNEMWNKTYGGKDTDDARAVALTDDGGFIIAGATMSYGKGGSDVFITKTDEYGNIQWTTIFGWHDFESSEAIVETTDGYAAAGYTISTGAGDFDGLLLKIDKNGNILWYKTFGREDRDGFSDMIYENGSFILAGEITVNYNPHKEAGWIVKCNDAFPPEMGIIKPENGIYINDRKIISFPQTVAIGKITFEAEINRTIEEMNCYIDGDLNKTFYSPPFMVEIDKKGIAWHNVKFVAYYGNAGENRAARKRIFMINPFPAASFNKI